MPRRLLLGSHDIKAFTTKMARWPMARDLVAALAVTGLAPDDPSHAAAIGGCSGQARAADAGPDEHASTAITARSRDLLPHPSQLIWEPR